MKTDDRDRAALQAAFWAGRWKRLLAPPPDAELRAVRLGRDLARWQDLQRDIAEDEDQLARLLADVRFTRRPARTTQHPFSQRPRPTIAAMTHGHRRH